MAIKKISEFTSGTPTASDKILIEQDGAGKSTTISNAVNTCSLTLEEIQATTDLTGKITSAKALYDNLSLFLYHRDNEYHSIKVPSNFMLFIVGDNNSHYYLGLVGGYVLKTLISSNVYDSNISIDKSTSEVILPTGGWYYYAIIK